MNRREFIALLGSTLVALSRTVRAEQAPKVARIGYLYPGSQAAIAGRTEAMLNGLRDLGYIEGRNLVVERRYGEWKLERLRDLADELVALKVDVIVAAATAAARAAKQATSTIPIVAVSMGDPVGDDLVASLGSPGGNLTGNTFLGPELVAKRLQLFRDAVPGFSRLAALWHPGAYGEATMAGILKETESAAARSGVQLQLVGVAEPHALDNAFSAAVGERADALIVLHHQYAGAGPAQPTLSGRAHVSGGGMMVTGGKSSQSSQGARPLVEQWIAAC